MSIRSHLTSKQKTKAFRISFFTILLVDWLLFLSSTVLGWFAFKQLFSTSNNHLTIEGNQYLEPSRLLVIVCAPLSMLGCFFIPIILMQSWSRLKVVSDNFIRTRGSPLTRFWSTLTIILSSATSLAIMAVALHSQNVCNSYQNKTRSEDISSCTTTLPTPLIESAFYCCITANGVLLFMALWAFILPFKDQKVSDSYRYTRSLRAMSSIASSIGTHVDSSTAIPTTPNNVNIPNKYYANVQLVNESEDIQIQNPYRTKHTQSQSLQSPIEVQNPHRIRHQNSFSQVKRKQIRKKDYPSTTSVNTFFDAQSQNVVGGQEFNNFSSLEDQEQDQKSNNNSSSHSPSSSHSEISTPKRSSSLLTSMFSLKKHDSPTLPMNHYHLDQENDNNHILLSTFSSPSPPSDGLLLQVQSPTYIVPVPSYR